jgi:uncharacterized membrane protein
MGTGGSHASRASTGRAVDRLINFSDAVVAVAITVMVLPLIDIPGPERGQTIWVVLLDHAGQISTFLFTFFVVAIMWLTHNRILNRIRAYDAVIFWTNTAWLAAIVLLPWLSAMYGESAGGEGSVGLVYWTALAFISMLGSMLGRHIRRHPEFMDAAAPAARSGSKGSREWLRGPAFAAYFLATGVVSVFFPPVASWMPLGLIPLSIWLHPAGEGQSEQA